nr:Franean1_4349 family RiPP [Micromonospora sp. DSM 115978]
MSLQAMQFVIGKAATDQAFRQRLKADPLEMVVHVTARYSYEFTPEEVQALAAMDWDGLDGVAHDLDERISRVRLGRSSKLAPDPTCACTPESGSNPDK